MSDELRLRIISALVLAPIVLVLVWIGGWPFALLLMLAGYFMAGELMALLDPAAGKTETISLALVAAGAIALTVQGFAFGGLLMAIAGTLFGAGYRLWSGRGVGPAFVAYPYVVLPLIGFVWIRSDEVYGLAAVFWILGIVWATDIGAYFAGRSIGGPKLSPRWSPKKTWAGLIGGMLAAALVGVATALLLGSGSAVLLGAISGALAVIAQAGDIAESALKRRAGVKDSGTLIPGHGGILDRVDGLIAAVTGAALLAFLHGSAGPSVGVLIWP